MKKLFARAALLVPAISFAQSSFNEPRKTNVVQVKFLPKTRRIIVGWITTRSRQLV